MARERPEEFAAYIGSRQSAEIQREIRRQEKELAAMRKRKAELDAIFAHLYGLTTEDLRYILDPEDVCGKGCINETFRVLKEREHRELGEYRTKRLVMEAWNKFGFDR